MVKRLAVIASAVLQLGCSSSFLDQTVYSVFVYEPDGIEIKEKIVDFTQAVDGNSYQLRYCQSSENSQQECYQYKLVNNSADREQVYESANDNRKRLWLMDSEEYILNRKEYKVYKYALDALTTDGRTEHFWCPDFGIIIVKSGTWRNFRQLTHIQGSNQEHTIQALCKVVYNDRDFYFNRSEIELDSISSETIDQISNSIEEDLSN